MAHVSPVLLFITLLQLSRRLSAAGTWYSANVINDGDFSPKPISEIFSTDSPFSTKNPIVVLPPGSTPQGITITTQSTYGTDGSTYPTSASPENQYVSTTASTYSTQSENPDNNIFPFQIIDQGNGMPVIKETRKPQGVPPNYFVIYQQAPQSLQNFPSGPSGPQQSFQDFSTPSSTFSTAQTDISSPQSTYSTFQPDLSSFSSTFSTQAPTSTTGFSFSTIHPDISTTSSTFSTLAPQVTSGATFSTPTPEVTSTRTTVSISSSPYPASSFQTTPSPITQSSPSPVWSTISPISFQPNKGQIGTFQTTRYPQTVQGQTGTVPTPLNQPCVNITNKLPLGLSYPSLRIRMISPSGSITNVFVNQPSSTRRPSTTTKRITTTRTRKPRRSKNSYEGCLNACKEKKSPLCGAPLAAVPIDPNTLKGFPSICHMACWNSFKKIQYEMITDGRCGRLRNRIRTLDSDQRLKRVELNKVQYTIVNDPQTVVEVSNLPRK